MPLLLAGAGCCQDKRAHGLCCVMLWRVAGCWACVALPAAERAAS